MYCRHSHIQYPHRAIHITSHAASIEALSNTPPPPQPQPIKLTLFTDPARPLSYAAAYGSGDLVLAPGESHLIQ